MNPWIKTSLLTAMEYTTTATENQESSNLLTEEVLFTTMPLEIIIHRVTDFSLTP